MKQIFTLLLSGFLTAYSSLNAQCTDQVTHTSDTATVAGSVVTVTSAGCVDVNTVYCASTVPYFIGFDYSTGNSCTGSYTFTFSPAVGSVTLNFSGLSSDPSNNEIVVLMVNNAHYAIPAPGTANACDPMAVLTPSGDVGGCTGCGVSGWNGTTIPGPITTLTVIDSVTMGAPAGSIFSLFVCPPDLKNAIGESGSNTAITLFPNPAVDHITLSGAETGALYSITDVTGNIVMTGKYDSRPIDISALAPGMYFVLAENTGCVPFIKQE